MSELVLTEQDNQQTLDVVVGASITLRLPENPVTGYRWTIDSLDAAPLSLQDSEFIQASTSNLGAAGTRTITLIATRPGGPPGTTTQTQLGTGRLPRSPASR